ncbi:hypothetical protein DUI87_02866 [Hirundo rustica rustica]|uniref:CCHC-type domain-containing protein n=1 Tax=Hirundo rustica rustica TaxID=333673 RepID=A0A3M0L9E6_HIRRU|nr:hypothetical protein DUI87_02866 [Hirundo rustica rustica]
MVRDDEAAEENQDMSITDDDIICITASEGIPIRKAKTLEFSRQASSFLLSKDFMRQFFRQFSEAASGFQRDPMSSFSRIFLLRKGAAEKSGDAQQSLVPVLQEKERKQNRMRRLGIHSHPQDTDIKNAARKAIVQIPLTGVTESSYTDIKQGPSESFTSFINRLTQAVDRQVSDEGVKPHLIQCLAFANANPECKRVISAMPGQPSMAEILEACSKVGTPQHVATILGDQVEKAVKDAFANFQQRQCYKCGKQGHFKKDCPELAEIASSLDVCPRNPETGQIEGPFKLITWGKGYACVSTAVGLKWLVARHVKPYRIQTQAETDPKPGGREVGTQT